MMAQLYVYVVALALLAALGAAFTQGAAQTRAQRARMTMQAARKPLIAGNWKMNTDLKVSRTERSTLRSQSE